MRGSVFDGATIRFCFGGWHGLSGQGGIQGLADVVFGLGTIGRIGRTDAVDRTHVDEFSLRVDDKHVGGGFGLVLLADFARGIEENGGGEGLS